MDFLAGGSIETESGEVLAVPVFEDRTWGPGAGWAADRLGPWLDEFLDGQGFAPFGRVVEGLSVVDSLYAGYGEGAPSGHGPSQPRMQSDGNVYLRADFPKLDYVKTARLVKASPKAS